MDQARERDPRRTGRGDEHRAGAAASWSGSGEWDSGSGVTERWGVGNDFAGARDTPQSFAGRGPKGYRRSDDRIREDVSQALTDDAAVDASDVTVQVQDGEVTLTGTIAEREQKRRAEDLTHRVAGVRQVINDVRVARPRNPTTLSPTGPVS